MSVPSLDLVTSKGGRQYVRMIEGSSVPLEPSFEISGMLSGVIDVLRGNSSLWSVVDDPELPFIIKVAPWTK